MADEKEDLYKPKEREKLLSPEGNVVYFLTKVGQIVILNIVWFVSCLPVVTIGPATTSLYYAMMKNIRRNRSYPLTEYWASFKRTLGQGSAVTVGSGLWIALLWYLRTAALSSGGGNENFASCVYLVLMAVTAAVLIYLFPVMSRFSLNIVSLIKLAFVMAVRYIGYTVVLLLGTVILVWIWFYFLPLPTIFIWPGIWCYLSTFMIEKALRKYMPAPSEGEDAWYYE